MSKSPKVLICGAGIAGGAFACCLLRAYKDADITIVERDPTPRLTGASIDIRSSAVDVIKWLGVEESIRAETTKEEGLSFVGNDGQPFATFMSTGRTDVQSFTSEYEIFRGALAKVFLDPVMDRLTLICNETVEHYEQHEGGVTVTFASGKQETYDLMVGADGLGSKTRGTMLSSKARQQVKSEGIHAAYFTIEKDLLEGSRVAKWHSMPGGRTIFLRPDPHPEGRTRAHFLNTTWKSQTEMRNRLDKALEDGHDAYKQLLDEQFRGGTWLSKEVLEGMHNSKDFYCSPFAQVRSPRLHDGAHVVLLGDAGYATPGIGTSLAIIGSYILAGELLTQPDDYAKALANYEGEMKKLVHLEQSDNIMMQLISPQSQWGLNIRNSVLWLFAAARLDAVLMQAASWVGWMNTRVPLPKYAWPEM